MKSSQSHLAAIGAAIMATSAVAAEPQQTASAVASVGYVCAGGKTIAATYFDNHVELALSDGRSLQLPQAMSGSGIRYADAKETQVFWSKGKDAFLTESGVTSYADCKQQTD